MEEGNLYFNGASPMNKENAYVDLNSKVEIGYEEKDGKITLKTNVYDFISSQKCKLMKTEDIAPAFEPEQNYENPDGTPITFDTDFFGKKRSGNQVIAGPFADGKDANCTLF